jgi:hypothetical protein
MSVSSSSGAQVVSRLKEGSRLSQRFTAYRQGLSAHARLHARLVPGLGSGADTDCELSPVLEGKGPARTVTCVTFMIRHTGDLRASNCAHTG